MFTAASLIPDFSICSPEIDIASEVKIILTSPPTFSRGFSTEFSGAPSPYFWCKTHGRSTVPTVAGQELDHHSPGVSLSSVLPWLLSTPPLLSSKAAALLQCISLLVCCKVVSSLPWNFGSSGWSALQFFHLLPQAKTFPIFRVIPVPALRKVVFFHPFIPSVVSVIIIQSYFKTINNKS